MGLLGSARKLLVLLDSREIRLRRQMQRERAAVDELRARVIEIRKAIEGLQREAQDSAYRGPFVRETLLRARGQRAVLLYAISHRKIELNELIDQVGNAEQDLRNTGRSLLELGNRQGRHRERIAKERGRLESMRELQAEEDFLEGRTNGFD